MKDIMRTLATCINDQLFKFIMMSEGKIKKFTY